MSNSDRYEFVIYLSDKSIDVYSTSKQTQHLDLPKEVFCYQEILDKVKFQQILINFFTILQLGKKRILLVVAPPLTYLKTVSNTPMTENIKADFFNSLPINSANINYLQLKGESGYNLIATNKELLDIVSFTVERAGGVIQSAVPRIIFGKVSQPDLFGQSEINIITGNEKLINYGNFLANKLPAVKSPLPEPSSPLPLPSSQVLPSPQPVIPSPPPKKSAKKLIIISLGGLVIIISWGLILYKLLNR